MHIHINILSIGIGLMLGSVWYAYSNNTVAVTGITHTVTQVLHKLELASRTAGVDRFTFWSKQEKLVGAVLRKAPSNTTIQLMYQGIVQKKNIFSYIPVWEQQKQEVLDIVNMLRRSEGLRTLSSHSGLDIVAQRYAYVLYTYNHFSHVGLNNDTIQERIQFISYPYLMIGENLAKGFTNPKDVVRARRASPTHRANILEPSYQHMGLGRFGDYRVQIFGSPKYDTGI